MKVWGTLKNRQKGPEAGMELGSFVNKRSVHVRQNQKRELKSEMATRSGTGTVTQGLAMSHCLTVRQRMQGWLVTWLWWGQGRRVTSWSLSSWTPDSVAIGGARETAGKQVNPEPRGEHKAGCGSLPRAGTPALPSPGLSWSVS